MTVCHYKNTKSLVYTINAPTNKKKANILSKTFPLNFF